MAGYVDSWIESYTAGETPCLLDVTQPQSPADTCILWLIGGLALGAILTEKKKKGKKNDGK